MPETQATVRKRLDIVFAERVLELVSGNPMQLSGIRDCITAGDCEILQAIANNESEIQVVAEDVYELSIVSGVSIDYLLGRTNELSTFVPEPDPEFSLSTLLTP